MELQRRANKEHFFKPPCETVFVHVFKLHIKIYQVLAGYLKITIDHITVLINPVINLKINSQTLLNKIKLQ